MYKCSSDPHGNQVNGEEFQNILPEMRETGLFTTTAELMKKAQLIFDMQNLCYRAREEAWSMPTTHTQRRLRKRNDYTVH